MLKVLHSGNAMPMSMPIDPSAEFEPGMFAQLKIIGNDIIAGLSDGTAPIGIIDDIRSSSLTKAQIDEVVVVSAGETETNSDGYLVSKHDVTQVLEFPNISEDSFTSTVSVILNKVNGAITIPAGTRVNYDSDEAVRFNSKMMETIYHAALTASKDCAKELGKSYETFQLLNKRSIKSLLLLIILKSVFQKIK